MPNLKQKSHGFSLVETLVALAVLAIFFAAIAAIFQQILQNVGESRVRTTALAVAQEKMEIVRNLSYDDVGTSGGIPQGPIAQTETTTINTQDFTITTSVVYIDDPFDSQAPADTIATDYKRVRIEVTWEGAYPSRYPVTLVSNIVPKGIESIGSGGTLFLQVFNANSTPIANAVVTIDNDTIVPAIHLQTLSDTNGLVILPGSPACTECYEISVTKNGYSTHRTYGIDEVANPLLPHATVIEGQISQMSFTIDETSLVTINSVGSRSSGYPPVANVFFTLRGSKIIGYDTNDEPVYKYSYSTNTGGGSVQIVNLEWDTYTIDLTNSAHNLGGSNPLSPFAVPPKTNQQISMVNISKSINSLLVSVTDANNVLLASASAKLTNTATSYDVTIPTGATGAADFGQAFFPSLAANTYDLSITLDGYQEATASLPISGAHIETVTLNPVP